MLTKKVSTKIEYDYDDFGRVSTPFGWTASPHVNSVKLGLAYHFS